MSISMRHGSTCGAMAFIGALTSNFDLSISDQAAPFLLMKGVQNASSRTASALFGRAGKKTRSSRQAALAHAVVDRRRA